MVVPPRGDAWTADVLREAGRRALGRGAIESALAHLRRALAEPPPPGDARAAAARARRHRARRGRPRRGRAPPRRVRGARGSARPRRPRPQLLEWALRFLGPPDQAVRVMEEALAELPAGLEDERRAIEALGRFTAYWYGLPGDEARWADLRAAPPEGDGAGTKMLLAATAWQWAVSDGPADRCVELALRAFAGGTLLEHDPSLMSVAAGSVLTMADHAESLTPWDTLRTRADTHGGATVTVAVQLWRGWALARRGELEEAEASLREALAGQVLWGLGAEVRAYTVGLAAETLLERGDVAGVRALIDGADRAAARQRPAHVPGDRPRAGRAGRGRPRRGRRRHRRARRLADREPRLGPVALSPRARPPRPGPRRRGGRAGVGGPRLRQALGRPRRDRPRAARARHGGGGGRLEHLREAVATLDGSPSRLELAKARAALGDHLLRAGRTADAATPLHAAAALADECGAVPLAASVRDRLAEAGIAAPQGPAPLTALERRVAALVAEGVDANGVAQALFLTPRAARDHLDARTS